MKMNLVNIKNMETLSIGCELFHTKKNIVVKVADILDDTVKLEGNNKYNSLATIKRWYKLVANTEGNLEDLNKVDNIEPTSVDSMEVIENKGDNNIIDRESLCNNSMDSVKSDSKESPTKSNNKIHKIKVDNTELRKEIIKNCLDLDYTERVASKYNSFYLNKVNLLEVMTGKSKFIVYFNCKYLMDKDKELLDSINPKVRGNNGVITVKSNEDKKRVILLIKSIYCNFNK